MEKLSLWKDDEVEKLFRFIENGKNEGKNLSALFSEFAILQNRQPNSVRNYYYLELKLMNKDKNRCQKFNMDLQRHKKIEQEGFTNEQTKELIKSILKLNASGKSIRKCCQIISNGDLTKMVRYQNKYRSVLKNDKKLLDECYEESLKEGYKVKKFPSNVEVMPLKKSLLTENDINSLFMGLVKLVKKQAQYDAGIKVQKENEKANENLRKTLVALKEKEKEIETLRSNIKIVSQDNEKLVNEVEKFRARECERLSQTKMKTLKAFKDNAKLENKSKKAN